MGNRALLLGAIALLWPLLRWLRVKTRQDLGLERNPRWLRDVATGFILSGLPVLFCEIVLVNRGLYSMRSNPSPLRVAAIIPVAVVVPLIEEAPCNAMQKLSVRYGCMLLW